MTVSGIASEEDLKSRRKSLNIRKGRSQEKRMSSALQGQVAIVTGASRGIGRATALELASHGAHVCINFSSNAAAAEEVASLCAKAGGSASLLGFNVSDSKAVDEAFDSVKEKHGKLDI